MGEFDSHPADFHPQHALVQIGPAIRTTNCVLITRTTVLTFATWWPQTWCFLRRKHYSWNKKKKILSWWITNWAPKNNVHFISQWNVSPARPESKLKTNRSFQSSQFLTLKHITKVQFLTYFNRFGPVKRFTSEDIILELNEEISHS